MRASLAIAVLGFSILAGSLSAQGPAPTSPVVADILKLSNSKVGEDVILAYVQRAPRVNVKASDLLLLHSNGISSRVMIALLNPEQSVDAIQPPASTEAPPTVSDPAPAPVQATSPSVTAPTDAAVSVTAPLMIQAPYVDYVAAPVYVGAGSIHYYDDWWGVGWGWGWSWGWGYVGWGSWYPWYGCGWRYPYYAYGYYARCGYGYSHYNHHGHGHYGHNGHNGNGGYHRPAGGQNGNAERSTLARTGGNLNNRVPASAQSRSGNATARPQVAGNRSGTSTANASSAARNSGNVAARPYTASASPGGNTVTRSATAAGRATTAGVRQNGIAHSAHAGVATAPNRPTTVPAAGRPATGGQSIASPSRSVPASVSPGRTATPVYTGRPSVPSGNQTSAQGPAGRSTVAGPSGSYATARSYSAPSYSAPSAARSYAAPSYSAPSSARSYSAPSYSAPSMNRSYGSSMGGYSGGASRGFSGGGGGRSFSGGGSGGGGGRR